MHKNETCWVTTIENEVAIKKQTNMGLHYENRFEIKGYQFNDEYRLNNQYNIA